MSSSRKRPIRARKGSTPWPVCSAIEAGPWWDFKVLNGRTLVLSHTGSPMTFVKQLMTRFKPCYLAGGTLRWARTISPTRPSAARPGGRKAARRRS